MNRFQPFKNHCHHWLSVFIVTGICLILISGCGKHTILVYPIEQFSKQIVPGNTYVVLGQTIGKGNIDRVAYALQMHGQVSIKSKGVQTPDAETMTVEFNDPQQIDFLVTDRSGHAYRIWEINPGQVHENARALLFCQMFGKGDFVWMPHAHAKSKKSEAWMVPVEYGKENFFYGIAFFLTRPGIYYLGEAVISGTVFKQSSEQGSMISIGDYQRGIRSFPDRARSHLENFRIDTTDFFDLSGKWKKISWEDWMRYKKGDPSVSYATP
jgi:hypothetical protein